MKTEVKQGIFPCTLIAFMGAMPKTLPLFQGNVLNQHIQNGEATTVLKEVITTSRTSPPRLNAWKFISTHNAELNSDFNRNVNA